MPIDFSVFTDKELDAIEKQNWSALPDVKLNYLEAALKSEESGKPQEEVMSTWDAFSRQFERAATAVPRALKNAGDWVEEKLLTPEQRQRWQEFAGRNEDANSPPSWESYDQQAEGESRVAMQEQPAVSMAGFLAGNIADPSNLIPFGAAAKALKNVGTVGKGIVSGMFAGAVGGAVDPNYEEYGDDWKTSAMKIGAGAALGGIVGGVMGKYFPDTVHPTRTEDASAPKIGDELAGPPDAADRIRMVEERGTPTFRDDPYAIDAQMAKEAAERAERAAAFPEPTVRSDDPNVPALLKQPDEYAIALKQKEEQDALLAEANRILVKNTPKQEESAMAAAFKKVGYEPKPEEVDTRLLHARSIFDDDVTRVGSGGERLGGFSTREAAQMASESKGLKDSHVVVPVDDGFVLRPVKTRTEVKVRGLPMSDPDKIALTEIGYKMGKAEPTQLKADIEARAKETGRTPIEISREARTARKVHQYMVENKIPEPKDELEALDLTIRYYKDNIELDC